jgi:hypothetical protein
VEAVAHRHDNAATLLEDGRSEQGIVPSERDPHRLGLALPERGAALDVCEEERHRPARQLGHALDSRPQRRGQRIARISQKRSCPPVGGQWAGRLGRWCRGDEHDRASRWPVGHVGPWSRRGRRSIARGDRHPGWTGSLRRAVGIARTSGRSSHRSQCSPVTVSDVRGVRTMRAVSADGGVSTVSDVMTRRGRRPSPDGLAGPPLASRQGHPAFPRHARRAPSGRLAPLPFRASGPPSPPRRHQNPAVSWPDVVLATA